MTQQTDEQILFAELLAQNLVECGHDVTDWDLLDCLGSVGLKLVADEEAIATAAYFQALSRHRESEGAPK